MIRQLIKRLVHFSVCVVLVLTIATQAAAAVTFVDDANGNFRIALVTGITIGGTQYTATGFAVESFDAFGDALNAAPAGISARDAAIGLEEISAQINALGIDVSNDDSDEELYALTAGAPGEVDIQVIIRIEDNPFTFETSGTDDMQDIGEQPPDQMITTFVFAAVPSDPGGSPAPVPEPSTLACCCMFALGAVVRRRRRRTRNRPTAQTA
jgi:hypothetical protein